MGPPRFLEIYPPDNLALLHSSKNLKTFEGTLSQEQTKFLVYFQTWKLKLSHTETVTTSFHLNNKETKRELNTYNSIRLLAFFRTPLIWW